MVEFADLFESEEEGFVKKAKVGITLNLLVAKLSKLGQGILELSVHAG